MSGSKRPILAPSPESPRYTTTFTTMDVRTRPVPSVHYLRSHAACVRVVRKSGATAYIEEPARDIARLMVLAEDESSAGALARAAATKKELFVSTFFLFACAETLLADLV